jgi:hypothetical protein
VQVRIDIGNNVEGPGALARRSKGEVGAALGQSGCRLMRAEVHLGAENADKAGAADKRRSTAARRWRAQASSRQPRPVHLPLLVGVAMTTPVR